MNIEEFREYCLAKENVTEGFPFGESVLVFKVNSKMFALLALNENPFTANLKCEPEKAIQLREEFRSIVPGYHMNKQHWNTLVFDGSIPAALVFELIDDSYNLVSKVKKKRPTKS